MISRILLVLLFLALLALDWAALDDITTDKTATSFTLEYTVLALSVPILTALAWGIWRDWRRGTSGPGSRPVR
ncbi:MAG: hypothetical protein M1401_12670 [Chloroflexi bacterium]|nr:hypothetical protein [Chloroflexota bacterium]